MVTFMFCDVPVHYYIATFPFKHVRFGLKNQRPSRSPAIGDDIFGRGNEQAKAEIGFQRRRLYDTMVWAIVIL